MDGTRGTPVQQEIEVAQAAGIIALGSIVSRVLGVVRETVKAGLFGATGSVGALEVAIRVPTLLYDLLVGNADGEVWLVPGTVREVPAGEQGGKE